MNKKYGSAVFLALLAACSTNSGKVPNDAAAQRAIIPPTPDQTGYTLGPGDKITVTVFGQPDLSVTNAIIGPNGDLSLPLVGTLRAQGETAEMFGKKVEAALGPDYLRRPDVTVNVVEYASRQVIVDGQVNNPAVIPLFGTSKLSKVIVQAGGTSDLAKLNEVVIVRQINGQRMAARFDLRAIQSGQLEDPVIYGDDRIFVGFNSLRSVYQDVLKSLPVIALFQRF